MRGNPERKAQAEDRGGWSVNCFSQCRVVVSEQSNDGTVCAAFDLREDVY